MNHQIANCTTYMNAKRSQIVDDGCIAVDLRTIHDPDTARTRVWGNNTRQRKLAKLFEKDVTSKRTLGDVRLEQPINALETE